MSDLSLNEHNKLIVFTAPSGAGKTTIVRHLLKEFDELKFSISATTREKRSHEEDGKDYFFLTTEQFKEKIEEKAFVEWMEVYSGQYYGTLKSEISRIWEADHHVIFDIDVKGAKEIKDMYGDRCLAIFVKPPTFETLVKRLKNRKTESDASLKKRIKRMKEEMGYENYFDITLINDVLEETLLEAKKIVQPFIMPS